MIISGGGGSSGNVCCTLKTMATQKHNKKKQQRNLRDLQSRERNNGQFGSGRLVMLHTAHTAGRIEQYMNQKESQNCVETRAASPRA